MKINGILETLSNETGISGSEMRVADYVYGEFKKSCEQVEKDALGNVIGLKEGMGQRDKKRKIMLAAHMDEIGFMVKKIHKQGFLLFTNIGGVDYRTLLGQEVIIHGKKDIYGVIGAKPPHLQKEGERKNTIKIEDLYIDVGFTKEEVEQWIEVGDFITIKRDYMNLYGKSVAGKALDDRAGIAVLLQCMKELENMKHEMDIYFVGTVQEEVGLRGAITSTYKIMPDIGIAVDVGHGRTHGAAKEDCIELGKGPAIALGPNIHPKIYERLQQLAQEYNIPHQIEVIPGPSGTDAWAIQVTQSGVPAGVLSIPLRYMHTSVELINMEDIKSSGRLLALFIISLNDTDLEEWLCY